MIALGVLGIGNSIVDVNALTIMQRAVPDTVLGRALGALEGLLLATLGLGALVAPGLIELVGPEAALVATGALLPVLALLTRPRLQAIDRIASAPEATELLARRCRSSRRCPSRCSRGSRARRPRSTSRAGDPDRPRGRAR